MKQELTMTSRRSRGVGKRTGALACAALLGIGGAAVVAGPASAEVDEDGYTVLFDGTEESFDQWEYTGGGGFEFDDGLIRPLGGDAGGFGTLWFPETYGDFSLKVEFRDDAPGGEDDRGNSGVQVRFPDPTEPSDLCGDDLAWIIVQCGHEVQINDSPEGDDFDPRKTGSIYGFADLDLEQAQPSEKGTWDELEVRVVGQDYTVLRNGEVINEYENVPDVPFPGRPDDPGSSARGLNGYIGLQSHGATADIISFRDVRIKELPRDEGDVDISVEIDESDEPGLGHLALSVDGSSTVLEEDGSDAQVRQFDGGLPTVSVTDTRSADEIADGAAWYVLGSASDFQGEDASITADHLGWTPELIEAGESGQVAAGDPVVSVVDDEESAGLVDQELLGTSASADVVEEGEWSAAAELSLRTPASVEPGSYNSTLTLSLFE